MIKELEIGSAREVLFWKRQEVKVNKYKGYMLSDMHFDPQNDLNEADYDLLFNT